MSAEAVYHEMGLEGYRVEDTWQEKDDALYVLVSVPRESLCCRHCGCGRVHRHESRQRFWKAAPVGLTPVFVTMKTPRVKCLSCASRTWHQPTFAAGQRQITKKFEEFLEVWLSRLTIQDAVEALRLNAPLATAYSLKEDLRQFWSQKSMLAAERFLDDWCRRADASGLRVLKTMAKTLRAHRSGLLDWYLYPISSGPLEGINNKIGAIQRRAYGYRNDEHLRQRILTMHHTKFTIIG